MPKAHHKVNELFMSFTDYASLRAHFGRETVDMICFDNTNYPMLGESYERHTHAANLYQQMIDEEIAELETQREELDMDDLIFIDEPNDLGLFVIRNTENEYLVVDSVVFPDWGTWEDASWLEGSDAEMYNANQWEIVPVDAR